MRQLRLLGVPLFTLLITAAAAASKPGGVAFSGGDGSTLEKAVIIKAASEDAGVQAEYDYLGKHFPGYRRGAQSVQGSNGRTLDAIEFTTAAGAKKTVYFDVTDFFGK